MGRVQRDEPSEPAISDVSSTDSGAGGDDATFVTAINHIIDALEEAGVIVRS